MADDEGPPSRPAAVPLAPRPLRPFRSDEEYLYAMQEDLAEWLHLMYPDLEVCADTFFEALEDGVVLCKLANRALALASEDQRVPCRTRGVRPGTFHARDNVAHFIQWCRGWLRVPECLLFESDDLVLRKNRRSFVLCLLEVARRGITLCPGLPAPMLVLLEQEIDDEIARDAAESNVLRPVSTPEPARRPGRLMTGGRSPNGAPLPSWAESDYSGTGHEADDDSDAISEMTASPSPPRRQIVTNDLRSLHERVAELLSRCRCPSQFPMLRVGDGKYRIGETQLLIFVRVLRSHVMVRVGGGWDTLEHYLDKHDPCRGRPTSAGRRFSTSSKTGSSEDGSLNLHVTYHRTTPSSSSSSRSSVSPPPPSLRRHSASLTQPTTNVTEVSEISRRPLSSTSCRRSSAEGHSSSENEGDRWHRPVSRKPSLRGSSRPSAFADSEDSCHSSSPSSVLSSCDTQPEVNQINGNPRRSKSGEVRELPPTERRKSVSKDSKIPTSSPSRNITQPQRRRNSTALKYRSTENLENGRLAASRSEVCLAQNNFASKNRRSGLHTPTVNRSGTLPRSRSGDTSSLGITLRRPRSASASRTSLDYTTRNASHVVPTASCQSSPGGRPPVPPLLEEILHDSDLLDTDEKLLQRMEQLIREYRNREEASNSHYQDEDPCLSSSSASTVENDCRRTTRTRRNSGLLTPGGSPSKIPIFTAWSGRE